MTWLGKILTIVVFLGALVWAYFTIQTFVLRTNWKFEADKYKTAYNEAKNKRQDEYNRYRTAEDALRRQLAVEQVRADSYGKQAEMLSAAARKSNDDFKNLQGEYENSDAKGVILQANLDSNIKELKDVRVRNYYLEDDRVKLVIAAEEARRAEVTAKNSEKLTQAIADDNAKRVEDLLAQVTDLKRPGGLAAGPVMRALEKPPPPVLANLRGEVTDVAGDLLTISIGSDAGLAVGTELEIYRLEGGARFLGTVKVTSGFNLYYKQAVVSFTPASNLPLGRLSAADLPRKGDLIRPKAGN